jgi:hypothetical protein
MFLLWAVLETDNGFEEWPEECSCVRRTELYTSCARESTGQESGPLNSALE